MTQSETSPAHPSPPCKMHLKITRWERLPQLGSQRDGLNSFRLQMDYSDLTYLNVKFSAFGNPTWAQCYNGLAQQHRLLWQDTAHACPPGERRTEQTWAWQLSLSALLKETQILWCELPIRKKYRCREEQQKQLPYVPTFFSSFQY